MDLFKSNNLLKKARNSKKRAVRQADLKTDLDIREKEDVIVVEKTNMVKFIIRMVGIIVMSLARIIILLLAIIGLAALFYPVTRQYLHSVMLELFLQIQNSIY